MTGFLATYIVPLSFVLAVTIGKEAYDDYKRHQRDVVANSAQYFVLDASARSSELLAHSHHAATEATPLHIDAPMRSTPSSKLRVGDLVLIEKNQRVPADCLLLRTTDSSGTTFVRTDQLDGETDWKLRVAVGPTQTAPGGDAVLLQLEGDVVAEAPSKDIHSFVGTITLRGGGSVLEGDEPVVPASIVVSLTAENMLWANTVLAAGQAVGLVVYTGRETRAVMNTSHPETKVGLLDLEINSLAKVRRTVRYSR